MVDSVRGIIHSLCWAMVRMQHMPPIVISSLRGEWILPYMGVEPKCACVCADTDTCVCVLLHICDGVVLLFIPCPSPLRLILQCDFCFYI